MKPYFTMYQYHASWRYWRHGWAGTTPAVKNLGAFGQCKIMSGPEPSPTRPHRGAIAEAPRIIADRSTGNNVEEKSLCLWVVAKGNIPVDLQDGLHRDFTEAELERIYARIHKTLAPASSQPCALLICGPSAVGKSSISDATANYLMGSPENAVEVDGAHFRAEHAGWRAVAQHGYSRGILHEEAWSIFKKAGTSSKLKKRVIAETIQARQHMIVPDTMNQPDKVDKLLHQLLEAGYNLHAVCLWAPLKATRKRGEPRSVREGKAWTGDEYELSMWETFKMAQKFAQRMSEGAAHWESLSMVRDVPLMALCARCPACLSTTVHALRAQPCALPVHSRHHPCSATVSLAHARPIPWRLRSGTTRCSQHAVVRSRSLECYASWGSRRLVST